MLPRREAVGSSRRAVEPSERGWGLPVPSMHHQQTEWPGSYVLFHVPQTTGLLENATFPDFLYSQVVSVV